VDCEIVYYLSLEQDLYHASSIYTGLCQLSKHSAVRLKFVVSRNGYAESAHTVCMQVRFSKSGESRLLAIDLSDHSDFFTIETLRTCDVYLKRSFYGPDVIRLPDELRCKVLPFGFNYACRSSASALRILATLIPSFLGRLAHTPQCGLRGIRTRIGVLEQFLTSPEPRAFERDPAQNVEPTILFQTRVWSPAEATDNVHEINEERVALVRLLRKAFGDRFQGGLVPTSYARHCYPDELSKFSSRHSQYITWGKKALIGINTRGLHHSLSFKFPEYFAASKCVISCPLRNELPVPVVEGQHYLAFRTAEECANHCDNILRNSTLAAGFRKEAWEYYQREIQPAAHLHNCLTRLAEFEPV
jgi:hypothetical protein